MDSRAPQSHCGQRNDDSDWRFQDKQGKKGYHNRRTPRTRGHRKSPREEDAEAPAQTGAPRSTHSSSSSTVIRVKDPAMKGNIHYDVPMSMIQPTAGLSEFLEGTGPGKQHHKACICKLWMEERCGQGNKCKSFHVCRDLVKAERGRCGAELDDTFLTEVAVDAGDGRIFAVGYNAVMRTRGLDCYRDSHNRVKGSGSGSAVTPITLCPHHTPAGSGACPYDKGCQCLHLKPQERQLRETRQRTPCCKKHGDASVGTEHSARIEIHAMNNQKSWTLPADRVALTTWLQRARRGEPITACVNDICVMHVRSRCKFGRTCEKLHLCRDWAEQMGLFAPQPRQTPWEKRPTLQTSSSAQSLGVSTSPAGNSFSGYSTLATPKACEQITADSMTTATGSSGSGSPNGSPTQTAQPQQVTPPPSPAAYSFCTAASANALSFTACPVQQFCFLSPTQHWMWTGGSMGTPPMTPENDEGGFVQGQHADQCYAEAAKPQSLVCEVDEPPALLDDDDGPWSPLQ
eukprot:TRINITY_DN2210_c0_g1_i1.p2 TRINITY_DN2210_c0_g1~~TRINITY_DN2210_c0_g1_i1.p2  ORF type:complete len:515 (+),score=141.08 TRINITY_DN2210_c0_g1_i1:85-1629(+)